MSAHTDKSQRFTFVYKNLYQLYKKSERNPSVHVLKTEPLHRQDVEVKPYKPVELLGKRLHRSTDATVKSLKTNLSELNDLHSRLKFMLTELEELVGDKKKRKS